MHWYYEALRKFADFKGRSSRKEFWYFVSINVLLMVVLIIFDSFYGTLDEESMIGLSSGIFSLLMFIPTLSVTVRRLHDSSRTGWWVLIEFVPIIGFFVMWYFLIQDSDPEINDYGANPKLVEEKDTAAIVLAGIFLAIPVLGVLGILAAVVLPAYQDYTVRAKLSEAHMISDTIMQAVEDYAVRERVWPANIEVISLERHPESPNVSSVEIDRGVIYVNVSQESGAAGAIIYIPTFTESGITWSCKESTVAKMYLPSKCR